MKLMLDTIVVSKIIRRRMPLVRDRYFLAVDEGCYITISSVVLHELRYGVLKSENPAKNIEKLGDFVDGLDGVDPFTAEDGELAGTIRAELAQRGEMIGPHDLLIAAHALRIGATIVTGNVREFQRVPGLAWADWTAA
jgi:tRNA(fMet)-specific endonuclease VapC